MSGPFATTSRLTPIQQMSLAILSRAACASMSTTTTTTRDRGDRYGPMEWAQWQNTCYEITWEEAGGVRWPIFYMRHLHRAFYLRRLCQELHCRVLWLFDETQHPSAEKKTNFLMILNIFKTVLQWKTLILQNSEVKTMYYIRCCFNTGYCNASRIGFRRTNGCHTTILAGNNKN